MQGFTRFQAFGPKIVKVEFRHNVSEYKKQSNALI